MTLSFETKALHQKRVKANHRESIENYRAIPIHLDNDIRNKYVRHSIQDSEGFLWLSGNNGVSRYDGYQLVFHELYSSEDDTLQARNPFLYVDHAGQLWAATEGLYKYDYQTESFSRQNVDVDSSITSIIEDNEGYLWLAGDDIGLIQYSTTEDLEINRFEVTKTKPVPDFIHSMAYDNKRDSVWLATRQGIYRFDIENEHLKQISTEIDKIYEDCHLRNLVIDDIRDELWLGTSKGLFRLSLADGKQRIYTASEEAHGLPIGNTTSVFIDSHNSVWVGLEKEGICQYRRATDDFTCLRSSIADDYKLPFATIEDINEDSQGNLWLAMSAYGLYRITPEQERFERLIDLVSEPIDNYFPHAFEGVVLENGDVWIATDGGGINIFNHKNGSFRNIKHSSNDKNTIASNSVLSITADANETIWASHSAGGLSRIDSKTMQVTRFKNSKSDGLDLGLLGDNIFYALADEKGGLWLSVWGVGLQYYDIDEGWFKNYRHKSKGGLHALTNTRITHLQLYDDKLFIAGHSGLEYLDLETDTFVPLLTNDVGALNYVLVESLEKIWIGSVIGLIEYNAITGEKTVFTKDDGLNNASVNYLYKDEHNRLWIATLNGIAVFDPQTRQFKNYYEKDGLVANLTSIHGEFFKVDDLLFVPTKFGINVINPNDLPPLLDRPNTQITSITSFSKERENLRDLMLYRQFNNRKTVVDYTFNSVVFNFASLSFVFPEFNKYKYRLVGWSDEFIVTGSQERSARFNNLPAGDYTFEVFSSNSHGVWDDEGASFSFTVTKPIWQTSWALTFYLLSFVCLIMTIMNLRVSMLKRRESELKSKVDEKTQQIREYANKLKSTMSSLETLNEELEQRVADRTAELQVEISDRKFAQSKLYHLAFHDSLTGLPNREWLMKKITELISNSMTSSEMPFGVMFLDGDRFKLVNDTFGHNVGDELLVAAATRLSNLLTKGQYAVRLGGDEFTILVEHVADEDVLARIAQSVVDEFSVPFMIDKHTIHFAVSVGVVLCNKQYRSVTAVLRDADIAMYHVKKSQKGTYKIFDQQMRKEVLETSEIEKDMREALRNDVFTLQYQPIIALDTNKVAKYEALIRWNDEKHGNVPPSVFIPIAEENGLISQIGNWVLNNACAQLRTWRLFDCLNDVVININVSPSQLRSESFLSHLDTALKQNLLEGKHITIELTESTLIENDKEIAYLFEQITKRGIDLAIDDFGTGYSSLAYLNELPVNAIKIDRKFVSDIDPTQNGAVDSDALEIVKAMVTLGHSLGMKVTAEGIETETQLRELKRIGVDYGQGYLVSKPIDVEDVPGFSGNQAALEKFVTENEETVTASTE
ncbi:MAG: EAL domain-containing protein [Pseudomonadota bacterium]